MLRKRFFQLYRYLHVEIYLFNIHKFLDIMYDRFCTAYKPSRDICIDESLIPLQGKIYFRQFIPSERARSCVKAVDFV